MLSRLHCNGHSLLLSSYLSRIGTIANPSCSACGHSSQDISHFIPHCPATDSAPLALWRLSVSLRSLAQALRSCPASGAPWSSAMPPSLGKGLVAPKKEFRPCCYSYTHKNCFFWRTTFQKFCFSFSAFVLPFRAVALNLFLPMDLFFLFFLVDPFIAIGHKNNHLCLFLPMTDGWTPSD